VDRLVADQLLQQRGRRVPGQPVELQEADIEPGAQPRFEFAVEHRQLAIGFEVAQQVGAQIDQELHALGQGVELGEDADARGAQRRA